MEFKDIEQLVNDKLKNAVIIDIQEQLPPVNKDVLMLLENGAMVVGYLTDDNDLVINSMIYRTLVSADIDNYDVIGWVDGLVGSNVLDTE